MENNMHASHDVLWCSRACFFFVVFPLAQAVYLKREQQGLEDTVQAITGNEEKKEKNRKTVKSSRSK
jgi:hypothetical protein